jgi:Zn-dependent protease
MLIDIIQSLQSGDISSLKISFAILLLSIPIFMLALSLHETAHGFVAYKLGDPTAKSLGRLSLNPAKHFDIFGFIMLIIVGFGWAKPVPINTRYFKKPKRDMAISATAGPLSNLALALIFAALFKLYTFSPSTLELLPSTPWCILGLFLYYGIQLNVMFAIFNLLPIPPFDGSRLLLAILPSSLYFKIQQYERYIFIALMALLLLGILDGPLNFCINAVMDLIMRIFNISWNVPSWLIASVFF